MSNPISDTAEYFEEKNNGSDHHKLKPPVGLRIFPSQERVSTPNDLFSPESPESRRPLIHQSISEFDPKQQWQKIVNRLPHRNSASRRSSQSRMNGGDSDVEEYEMGSNASSIQRHYIPPNEEDDILPSPEELTNASATTDKQDDHDNYFQNPFEGNLPDTMEAVLTEQNNIKKKKKTTPATSDTESSEQPTTPTTPKDDVRAKKHWGKTLDKVRLIANLHTLPHQPKPVTEITSTTSLAPYYPPLFDPVFISISKDPHGQPWAPVLLPFINVSITDSQLVTQGINQWVFRIELQYGDIKWVIKRTIKEFVSLHYTLKLKSNLSDSVPSPPSFPSQLQSWLSSAKGAVGVDRDEVENTSSEKYQIALKRRKQLTKYLQKLLIRAHMKVNYDLCEFLEISAISIVEDMGWKGKEGYLENKVNFVVPRLCHVIKPHLWRKQWVILRDSYVAFLPDITSNQLDDVFLFDKNLVVQDKTPGAFGKYHNHISISNQFRRIEIKGGRREVEEWMKSIQRVLSDSPWVKNHRFGSFAPIRQNSKVKWFVDAEDHFNAVGEAILSAKSEIYIADWWLSPELYLRRPPEKNQEFRLDRLLKRKAEEGVKIYIVVYKEMAVALTINSAHTKLWLQDQHKNIIVVRHPDHRSTANNVLFWSHHEKIVVVDNRLAFLGGLDLCWGRYDSQNHRLTDYPAEGHANEVFPGQDYSNPRVKDFQNVAQYDQTLINRNITPRMPWHDMTVGMVGPAARDVARHFIQRWNFLKASKGMHRPTVPFLMPKGEFVAARDESSFKGTCRVQMLRSSAQWSSGIEREHSIYNAYMECISKSKHYIYIENQFFISATTQDKLLRNKIAQAIVERIKRAHAKGEKYKVFIVIPLIPAFEGDLASKDASAARNVMHFQYITISRGGNSIMEKLREADIEPSDYIGWYSLRNWDKLVPKKERSTTTEAPKPTHPSMDEGPVPCPHPEDPHAIPTTTDTTITDQEGLKDSISPQSTPVPTSQSTSASEKSIWDDDDREHYVSELVYIHDKILIVDDRIVLIGSANINDRSQLGNRDSEIAMLIEDTDMVSSFMDGKEYKAAKFAHSLRMQLFKEHLGLLNFTKWQELLQGNDYTEPNMDTVQPKEPHHTDEKVTEEEIRWFEKAGPDQVLDHDKRSKAGIHDSTADQENTRFDAQVLDPLADHCCQNIWNGTAKNNTLIYRELFRCVPDDTVHTFEQHRKFLPDPAKIPHGHIANPELHGREIRDKLARVRGHLVQFPSDYLKDENMLGSLIRETVTPMVIFT